MRRTARRLSKGVEMMQVFFTSPGLEQTDILAIIDHHRLADIQTKNPIYFRNEPVGSTCTTSGVEAEKIFRPSSSRLRSAI